MATDVFPGYSNVMSYSICIIGNSHTAAIKQAWQNRKPSVADGVTLTYFAARMQYLGDLVCRDGALVARTEELAEKLRYTSGGRDRVDLAAYDAFVLIGLGFRFNLELLSRDYGLAEHQKFGAVDEVVSRACFSAMLATWFAENPAIDLLKQIRTGSNAPVLICPPPYRPDTELERTRIRRNRRLSDPAFCAALMERVEETGSALAARYNGEVVWQDKNTCAVPGFTTAKFTEGALRLIAADGRDDDNLHMNEEYGSFVLAATLKRLDEISGGHVLPHTDKKPRAKTTKARSKPAAKQES